MAGFGAIGEFAIGEYDTLLRISTQDALTVTLGDSELSRRFAPTVRDRTIVVPYEPRADRMLAAARRIQIEREDRTFIVPPDPRTLQ